MKKILILLITLLCLTACASNKKISGVIDTKKGAVDELLAVESEYPALYRKVEMVQYFNDEGTVKLVFANYHIDSFELDGTKYENPEFPTDLVSDVIAGEAYIGDTALSADVLSGIVFNGGNTTRLTGLDPEAGNKFNLTYEDDYYITSSDEWVVGDIRVSYYGLDDASSFTITGKIKDGVITLTDKSEISK